MRKRKEILEILAKAQRIDAEYELFGASKHGYRLNDPIKIDFVHQAEEKYGFILPEDYVQFITQVGDGGAGPDYGIYPFVDFLTKADNLSTESWKESYRQSLSKLLTLHPMQAGEVEEYAIVTREGYEKNPGKYFIHEIEEDNLGNTEGFFVLGTHGCQWDFGLILSGERRGQVFDTDNEGGYGFVADSFDVFYQSWLDRLADEKRLWEELEARRRMFQERKSGS